MSSSTPHLPGNILIVGATGVIGRYITNAILASNIPGSAPSNVTIFTSPNTLSAAADPKKQSLISSWKSQGVNFMTGDINSPSDIRWVYATARPNTIISALGRDSLLSQIPLLQIADETAEFSFIKWFFPSEYGTDIEYDPVTSPHEKPHQNKLRVREYVRDNVKRLKVTYLVTGPYIDMFLALSPVGEAQANGGFDVERRKAVVVGDGEGRVGFTSMPDVGKFVVAALKHPEASYNKALKVQSFVTTPNAILAEFQRQASPDDQPWTVEHTPLNKLRDLEKQSWDAGKPYATGFTLRRIWAEGGTLYDKRDNEALGVPGGELETLEDVVGRAVRGEGW